ncbi:MAG: hypothetical protein AMXMBFR33_25210 [Candidatus Xenobia bacterium]
MGRSGGFSLTEVMVGLLFLTIAVFGVIAAYFITLRAEAKDDGLYTAVLVAQTELNRVEMQLKANFSQNVAHPPVPVPGHPGYQVAVAQQPGPDPELTRVEAQVTWSDRQGPHRYDAWVYFARP